MSIVLGTAQLGLIYGLLAIGIYISFRILNVPDLTAEGSFTFGLACASMLATTGHPWLGILLAVAAGAAAGLVTGFFQTKCQIHPVLAGILTMSGLYSINMFVMGERANVTLIGVDRKRIQLPIPDSALPFNAVYASGILLSAGYLAFLLIGILRRRKKLTRGQVLLFLVCVLASSLLETVFFAVFLLKDQADRYLAQKEEAARERARAAVLEMRPHFILNTMTSIYYLCGQDPEKARQVILDFTSYLRDNFTALARDDTVPFTDELEHARAYLAVEQVRFENRLFVEFDTPAVQFRLPPLTLQPIVENAVKYGINPEAAPLLIRVVSRETAEGFEVTVTDNGPGFDEQDFRKPDDREPHVALNNIRERLAMMCAGTLTVERREEGGSAVTIRIPGR